MNCGRRRAAAAFDVIALAEAVRWYQADTGLILAGDDVPLDAVGAALGRAGRDRL